MLVGETRQVIYLALFATDENVAKRLPLRGNDLHPRPNRTVAGDEDTKQDAAEAQADPKKAIHALA